MSKIAPRLVKTAGLSFVCLMLLSALTACDPPGNDYAEYLNLQTEGWKYGDTLVFTPIHPDSLCHGKLVVGVRHESSFPYTSLWLETSVTDGKRIKIDTIKMQLADNFGSWKGRGIGASFQMTDTVAEDFLHRSGTPIKLRHIMRVDTLRGVTQVGIFFVPEKK